MPQRKRKPTSPGRRFQTVADFSNITKTVPERSLTERWEEKLSAHLGLLKGDRQWPSGFIANIHIFGSKKMGRRGAEIQQPDQLSASDQRQIEP